MQGSYKNNGLPRPYYMKPSSKKKHSPYSNLKEPVVYFTNSRRKLGGYLIMLLLFGTLMWWVSQDLRPTPEPEYEIVSSEANSAKKTPIKDNANVNMDKLINDAVGSKADKEIENKDLAGNFAHGSHGEKGLGVAEAPKGGVANEGAVVGSDEDKLVGTGKGKKKQLGEQQVLAGKAPTKGYQADISNDAAAAKPVGAPGAAAAAAAGAAAGIAQPVKPADRDQDIFEQVEAAFDPSAEDEVDRIVKNARAAYADKSGKQIKHKQDVDEKQTAPKQEAPIN
ncbi:uncharacterized protein SPAPADRAFT_61172 [Spathaspora passalidarum NRRL Y-27907]|uniref:Uncharacterized protein n=1 Tax=Spathaspora passalidarum (strain NRRL Y-27907 / 11-Y1) TaxID=619300 RepID=G3APB6_SPAPN|nr:uncharacterized protein SPAPADRAFT_61172 [Spathaspora passalidarum NRRL Y-27907]EGW32093.1 hypothetical protein SPAPADRAFT_61172 [Spathaspora passalidarum NRRL Y-27907]